MAACEVIFDTEANLLLSSGTASGKTEAAFLPALTEIYNNPSSSVAILYISPLKALINDQFIRLNELCEDAHIPVTKWHGDVNQNLKNKLIQNPSGILQITPESLEAMLMRQSTTIISLFSDLRFVIIDEVHHFMSNSRGCQLLCILERIQRLTNTIPRRIGLSATLGEYSTAEKWLNSGTARKCITPELSVRGQKIGLSVRYHLLPPNSKNEEDNQRNERPYYSDLFELTKGKRCIVFSNSKAEVEDNIATLKRIAKEQKYPDIYHVHHGSISATLREDTERIMKEGEQNVVTGATLTLELGIDLGAMERIVQTGAQFSVSSFVQRLGRSGRRDGQSEMAFLFREYRDDKGKEFFNEINWSFIRTIAIIQLYLEEHWIEPIDQNTLPYGLVYHQTMSYLFSSGATSPAVLAQNILKLSPFHNVSQNDYKEILRYLIAKHQLERMENGDILIGLEGEKLTNHFDFYAVFESSIEFTVKYGAQKIGSVSTAFPVGFRFALAGLTWQVIEVDHERQNIYVEPVKGISRNQWCGLFPVLLNTKIMKKMQEVLISDKQYSYLSKTATERLHDFRVIARKAGVLEHLAVNTAPDQIALFPWIGTKALIALSYVLQQKGYQNRIDSEVMLEVFGCYDANKLINVLLALKDEALDKNTFSVPDDVRPLMQGKFNRHIPPEILRKEYIADYIDVEDMKASL
ncbi:MAG: DEAD/DEAH box helicase [Synergistaceae bacterium]|nr:DEAD/DEAH box helicase [Synergistaceae bacterium]